MDSTVNENQKLHFEKKSRFALKTEIPPEESSSKPASKKIKHICEVCSKDYTTATKLKRHIERTHKRKRFNCNFCEYSSLDGFRLIAHISKHLDPHVLVTNLKERFPKYEDSFVSLTCPICKEYFMSVTSLKAHYLQRHQANRKFECDHCGWHSVTKENMSRHITCKHVNKSNFDLFDKERRFECTFKGCQKRFKTAAVLNQHIRTHSGRKSSLLTEVANKTLYFRNPSQLLVVPEIIFYKVVTNKASKAMLGNFPFN